MTSSPNKWSVYLLLIPARSAAMESYLGEAGEHFSLFIGRKLLQRVLNCPVANPRELAMHVTRVRLEIKLMMDAPQVRCNTSVGYLSTDL